MRLEDVLYCSECQEVFDYTKDFVCPECLNRGESMLDLLLYGNNVKIPKNDKFGIIDGVIIITLLWGIVTLAFYGAIGIIEIIF